MKKLYSFSLLALFSLSMVSCQTDGTEGNIATKKVNVKVGFAGEVDQQINGSRTAYDPETKLVQITGDEKIHVYYAAVDGNSVGKTKQAEMANGVPQIDIATNGSGGWKSTFTREDLASTAYDYLFVLPYSANSSVVSLGVTRHVLPSVQSPASDGSTFDSSADILIGQRTLIGNDQISSTDVRFKRLFVPLCVKLQDADVLIGAEAIVSVEFSAPDAVDPLAMSFDVTHAANAVDIETAIVASTGSKTVKVEYPDTGLTISEGVYNAWYLVNPTTLKGNIHVTITTTTRTLKCMVAPGDKTIVGGKLNLVTVKITRANTQVQTVEAADMKAVYDAGGDIYIGGVAINKAKYGASVEPAIGNLPAKGVCFLGNGVYTFASNPQSPGLVLIALPGIKPIVELSVSRALTDNFLCKNITIRNKAGFAIYLFNIGANVIDYIVFEGCVISNTQNISYFSGAGAYKNIIFRGCSFDLHPAIELGETGYKEIRIINHGNQPSKPNLERIEYVEFTDNKVFSAKAVNGCVFAADQQATMAAKIVINRNTFINYICSSFAMVTVKNAKSIECRQNLMWAGNTTYKGKFTNYGLKILPADGVEVMPVSALNFGRNFSYFPNVNISAKIAVSADSWASAGLEEFLGDNSVDPFDASKGGLFDYSTGTFIPSSEFRIYGAR